MGESILCAAVDRLRKEYSNLNWAYHDSPTGAPEEKMYYWPGVPEEKIMVVVHQSMGHQELFHRHDFFYFNYTYQGEYDSISFKYDHRITVRRGELYAGQPFAGHAICVHDDKETVIIGVLIKRDTFFRSFLPMLSSNSKLFHFLLDPSTNQFSDEFIHFKIEDDCNIRTLLEMMVIEYANKKEDTQDILKPLVLAFLTQVARQYAAENPVEESNRLSDKIVQYISEHPDTVTLKELGSRFSVPSELYFHPAPQGNRKVIFRASHTAAHGAGCRPAQGDSPSH